ncbi:hypothetical protein N0V88_005849 [Collariella sp. IMI 366227]|nr:hypothetical protein N0V88_005849 [Collariella sp. IMI 366227]
MTIDLNLEDRIVVYPYFTDTLLDLIRADPDFPAAELKKILRYVGEAIQEFHAKGWFHLDVKPDNVFVNWTRDEDGNKTVTDAALGNFGIAYKQPRRTDWKWYVKELRITPRDDILARQFTYFGPLNEGLLKLVDSREPNALKKASAIAELAVKSVELVNFNLG